MEMTEKTTGSGAARWGFYLMGLLILAMGLTLNTKAGLGVSPIISLSYAASVIWNRNFGDMTFVLYGIFVLIQAAIHLRQFSDSICGVAVWYAAVYEAGTPVRGNAF